MMAACALLSFHTLYVEVVREVEKDLKALLNRNNVLTGHSMRGGIGISWTRDMSLKVIKYTTNTRYCENERSTHKVAILTSVLH